MARPVDIIQPLFVQPPQYLSNGWWYPGGRDQGNPHGTHSKQHYRTLWPHKIEYRDQEPKGKVEEVRHTPLPSDSPVGSVLPSPTV